MSDGGVVKQLKKIRSGMLVHHNWVGIVRRTAQLLQGRAVFERHIGLLALRCLSKLDGKAGLPAQMRDDVDVDQLI
jgi:hypothetical protein